MVNFKYLFENEIPYDNNNFSYKWLVYAFQNSPIELKGNKWIWFRSILVNTDKILCVNIFVEYFFLNYSRGDEGEDCGTWENPQKTKRNKTVWTVMTFNERCTNNGNKKHIV